MTNLAPVTTLKGVGEQIASKFASVGIATVQDLAEYFPRKYSDYGDVAKIASIKPGLVTLRVRFSNISERRVRRGMVVTSADAQDDTGKIRIVWFNQPYRKNSLSSREYLLHGSYAFANQRLQIVNPSVELVEDVSDGSPLVPTYPEKNGIKSQLFRRIISNALEGGVTFEDILPEYILKKHRLISANSAYRCVHMPKSQEELDNAKRKFAFEELFVVMSASLSLKQKNHQAKAVSIEFRETIAKEFVENLPFKLTDAQRKVAWQIYKDIEKSQPMNRLIEGDVGSGKTVVAVMGAIMVLESDQHVAVVAPTEVLASQHYETLKKLLAHSKYKHSVELLTGSLAKKQKEQIKKQASSSTPKIIVGTHALLQPDIKWASLGLVIVDEQHRFGVKQRQHLHTASGLMPHVLCMSATPIPRSLALTVYGELDISVLDQVPSHKLPIETHIVSPNSTKPMYEAVTRKLNEGRQVYVVCPLIEESDTLNVASAEKTYESLKNKEFKGNKIGLLHGRLKSQEKEKVMREFLEHKIDVLVSTTVIEVGVDVPNSTEMIILGADRFGLAQLHQLRGRVGRGVHASSCYLVMSDSQKPSKRMQAIAQTQDGFKLAEYDLELRGAGAIYGTRQHGELDLRHVTLSDHLLIAEVRQAATEFIEDEQNMVKYPQLAAKINTALRLTYLN